jgi:hypothetical protein
MVTSNSYDSGEIVKGKRVDLILVDSKEPNSLNISPTLLVGQAVYQSSFL